VVRIHKEGGLGVLQEGGLGVLQAKIFPGFVNHDIELIHRAGAHHAEQHVAGTMIMF
jgi:hypothetical protein